MVYHHFYNGSTFYENATMSLVLILIFLFFTVISSIYNFASIFQLDLEGLFKRNEAWRFFTGLFVASTPQYFFLCIVLLFISRNYEYTTSTYAMVNLFLSTLIYVAVPSVCLNFWDKTKGINMHKYPNVLVVSFSVVNIIRSLRDKVWTYSDGKFKVNESLGNIVVLILLLLDGWSIHGAVISAIAIVFGILYGFKVPPFYWPCLANKRRQKNTPKSQSSLQDLAEVLQ